MGQAMKLLPAPTETAIPSTPIAAELQALFDRGGSPADGVRLVEILERARAGAVTAKPRTKEAGRGSHLPADWQPSLSEVAFALDRGMPQSRVSAEAEKFRNYWTAKSGAGATKRDWSATWRNWINAMEASLWPFQLSGPTARNQYNSPTCGDWIRCHPCRHGSPRAWNR
jgi:hypothetical protein